MTAKATSGAGERLTNKPLVYTEYSVEPQLNDYLLCGWSFLADIGLQESYPHHVLPDGCISIVYRVGIDGSLGPLILLGPRIKELRVELRPGDQYWGIRLWPDAGGVLLGIEPSDLRDRTVLLSQYFHDDARSLSAQLEKCCEVHTALKVLQEFFSIRQLSCAPLDQEVRKCVISINSRDGSGKICEIAASLGMSQRQLQRRFRARVGLTPKEYARIRRMRIAISNAIESSPKGWSVVAAQMGYSDQAHLSRETIAMTGLTPAALQVRIQPIALENVDP